MFGVEYKKYDEILACADPENRGSVRVLEKAGFRKGELLKGFYSRPFLGDERIRSDLQKFHLARPGVEGKKEVA